MGIGKKEKNMQFTAQKEKLLNTVVIVDRIVGKKESLPILSCVLLQVGSGLTISATNLESAIQMEVGGEVKEKGAIAVPGSILTQTLRSAGSDRIIMRVEEENLLIETRSSKTLIKSISHDEFPVFPKSEGNQKRITLPREIFLSGIQSVVYAASQSMIRPELGSLFVSLKDKILTFAATDSFRLAEKRISDTKGRDPVDVLIPLKHAQELSYILEHIEDEEVTLMIEDTHMTVSSAEMQFMSRVIDAPFPNYKEIIPKQFVTEAVILRSDLTETLKKARIFGGSEQNIGLHIYPKKKIFTATAQSRDIGEMSDTIEAAMTGEDLDINFHIDYLSDCLQAMGGESVKLSFAGIGKPLVIQGSGDSSFTYLVMPLNR